jgi:hypothetical protein
VPNIYLDPRISGVPHPDVLAVDRAGSGDLHAVEVKTISTLRSRTELRSILHEMKDLPFHFKYLALPYFLADLKAPLKFADYPELFDESGIGRIGIISFDSSILDASSAANTSAVRIIVKPERFLVRGAKLTLIEKFLTKAKPDIEVRL